MADYSSPFDDPVPRGLRVVLATLRIAVTLECWGAALARLGSGDDFGLTPLLTRQAGFPPVAANTLLDNFAWALAACGLLTLVRPSWAVLPIAIGWFGLVAAAGPLSGTDPFRPVPQAVRYLAPLALMLFDFWPPRVKFSLGRAMVALLFLRLGIVLSFAGQGFLAVMESRSGGPLVGQFSAAWANVFGWNLTTEQAQTAVGVIGGVYVGLAIGLLLVRSRGIALLMTACGGLGAMSYVVAGGSNAWDQTLLHAASRVEPAPDGTRRMPATRGDAGEFEVCSSVAGDPGYHPVVPEWSRIDDRFAAPSELPRTAGSRGLVAHGLDRAGGPAAASESHGQGQAGGWRHGGPRNDRPLAGRLSTAGRSRNSE